MRTSSTPERVRKTARPEQQGSQVQNVDSEDRVGYSLTLSPLMPGVTPLHGVHFRAIETLAYLEKSTTRSTGTKSNTKITTGTT